MKVLIVTGSVKAKNCGKNSFTGLDYVVGEIASYVGGGTACDVDVFTMTSYPQSSEIDNARIYSWDKNDLFHFFRTKNILSYLKIYLLKVNNKNQRKKNVRAFLIKDHISNLIKKNKYDLVHINGATFSCIMAAIAAKENNIPVLFSLHGTLFDAPNVTKTDVRSENALLSILSKQDTMIITTVSTGIKNKICKRWNISEDKIRVINNAVDFPESNDEIDSIRKKYQIDTQKHIIISVGSICERKNQIQLLRAFNLLPDRLKEKYIVVLAGEDRTNGQIKRYVEGNNLSDSVVFTGFIDKQALACLYKASDFNVLLSSSEGFGLSMIEAASFGIPTLTFNDLDAVDDVFSDKSMIILPNREDTTVKNGLIKMMNMEWDKKAIVSTVQKYNKDVYLEYELLYKEVVDYGYNHLTGEGLLQSFGIKL